MRDKQCIYIYRALRHKTTGMACIHALLLLLLLPLAAEAQHTLQRISIQVTLHHDGSARVRETRVADMSEVGTEGYITFNDMADMEVCDVEVRDDRGLRYVFEDTWDVNRSRQEKTGRCGLHYTDKGVELCWGIGDAGHRVYEINYTLTNLVRAYDDYDGFCYSFYEAGNTPPATAQVDITLENDSLNMDNARIWAFGFEGYKGFDRGYAGARSDGAMSAGDAIIILLQLNKGLLQPVAEPGGSFAETVKRKALEGSTYNMTDAGLDDAATSQTGGKNSKGGGAALMDDDTEEDYGSYMFYGMTGMMLFAGIRDYRKRRKERKRLTAVLSEKLGGKKADDMPYWRKLPLEGNLLLSGGVLSTVDSMMRRSTMNAGLKLKFSQQQLYDAFMLRMLHKGGIKIVTGEDSRGREQKLFCISKPAMPQRSEDVTSIYDSSHGYLQAGGVDNEAIGQAETARAMQQYAGYVNDAGVEYHIQQLLYEAAGEDHLLQPDELKKYVEANPLQWRGFAVVLDRVVTGCISEDNLQADDAQQVVGFLHYLRDFSLVGERYIEEVNLWKEYLVFASFYGIADQVRKDMKKIAPDAARLDDLLPPITNVESVGTLTQALTDSMLYAHAFQTMAERQIIAERRRAAERMRSSGGFGMSSRGGGGGHFGGGGSGFR